MLRIRKAARAQAKLRLALIGPAGSGKTYTALKLAKLLAGDRPVLVMDTEHGSSEKYADHDDPEVGALSFDIVTPDSFSPEVYIAAIKAAEENGYGVIVLDSLSHAWMGKDGALELVDRAQARQKTPNSFTAWRDVTPLHNRMIDAIVGARVHVIATMRAKTEYVQEKDPSGKTVIRKVGLQPVQRDGLEYEFDVVCDLDQDNNLIVGKTRCSDLAGKVFPKPGRNVADVLMRWLDSGVPADAIQAKMDADSDAIDRVALRAQIAESAKFVKTLVPMMDPEGAREAEALLSQAREIYARSDAPIPELQAVLAQLESFK